MSEQLEMVTDEVSAAPLPLPGGVLRAAREAHGYSLAEISQALKFGVRQLEALENDDYATLQGATFIRGFVRSYARYLRVDEVPLLAALEPQAPVAVAEVRPVEHMNAEMPSSVQDGSKRVYWMAAGVLVLGALAWFVLQDKGAPVTASTTAAPTPVTTGAEQPAAAEAAAPSRPPVAAQSAPVAPTPTVMPATAPDVTAEAAPAAPLAADTQPAVNPAERQLQLSFGGVSWVEIRDASNRILYSGNSTPDSRQSLRGRPPFQLVIGNAQSVKLRYEDRTIDLQPYTRVDVARLTLDDNTK